MRIALLGSVSWRVPPRHYGGWEAVTGLLADGLVRRGHAVTLFATGDSQTEARLVSVVPRPLSEDPELAVHAREYEALHTAACFERAGEFDLIHNHAGCFPLCHAAAVPTPVVTTLHGSGAESGSRLIYRRYRHLPYVSITDAERVLCPELYYAATIYHGIDVAAFPFHDAPGERLVYLGRLAAVKGVHLAIETARRAGLPLLLAGIVPPEEQDYFEARIRPALAPGSVDYIGPVAHHERGQLLAEARALLHLICYHEAFGLTMIEAMACGTPVIATPRGSVPELVEPGLTGFIVEGPQAAAEVAGEAARLDRAKVRRRAEERFDAERMVAEHEQVYRGVLGEHPRPHPAANSKGHGS